MIPDTRIGRYDVISSLGADVAEVSAFSHAP
jgi:hypothetical protein